MQLKGREKQQQLTAILVKSFSKPLGIEATDASGFRIVLNYLIALFSVFPVNFPWF